jgi:hypothetical protein
MYLDISMRRAKWLTIIFLLPFVLMFLIFYVEKLVVICRKY